jgi:hypothetical protein
MCWSPACVNFSSHRAHHPATSNLISHYRPKTTGDGTEEDDDGDAESKKVTIDFELLGIADTGQQVEVAEVDLSWVRTPNSNNNNNPTYC